MKRILAIVLVLIPASGIAEESLEVTLESSFESTSQPEKVQIAQAVQRDAEGYLAGSDMTRALRLKIEQLQTEHPELDSDELVEHALNEANAITAEYRKGATSD